MWDVHSELFNGFNNLGKQKWHFFEVVSGFSCLRGRAFNQFFVILQIIDDLSPGRLLLIASYIESFI